MPNFFGNKQINVQFLECKWIFNFDLLTFQVSAIKKYNNSPRILIEELLVDIRRN